MNEALLLEIWFGGLILSWVALWIFVLIEKVNKNHPDYGDWGTAAALALTWPFLLIGAIIGGILWLCAKGQDKLAEKIRNYLARRAQPSPTVDENTKNRQDTGSHQSRS